MRAFEPRGQKSIELFYELFPWPPVGSHGHYCSPRRYGCQLHDRHGGMVTASMGRRRQVHCPTTYISRPLARLPSLPPRPISSPPALMHTTASPTYYEALAADPELMQIDWDLPETIKFIKLAQYLKPYLSDTWPPSLVPVSLPVLFPFSVAHEPTSMS